MQKGLEVVTPDALITAKSKKEWRSWLRKVENSNEGQETEEILSAPLDTVGAVALDTNGVLASGVSRYCVQSFESLL